MRCRTCLLYTSISTKLGIAINNDIQADIFDKIVDADWLETVSYTHLVLCLGLDATVEGEEGDAGNEYASGDKLGPVSYTHLRSAYS